METLEVFISMYNDFMKFCKSVFAGVCNSSIWAMRLKLLWVLP